MSVVSNYRLARLQKGLNGACSYAEWLELARQHDVESGGIAWREQETSTLYDYSQIRERHDQLAELLESKRLLELLFVLNEGLHGNLDGIGNPLLYQKAKTGTKELIDSYITLVNDSLLAIANADGRKISRAKKIDFFRRAGHCYGRSALMLSGGAGLIYFHHGVVQSLLDHDLLPNVLSGASAGSWMCAQLGTKTNQELEDSYFLNLMYDLPDGKRPLKVLMGLDKEYSTADFLEQTLDQFVDDLTFQEAFEKTGRYINISIAPAEKHQASRLMNAITSPNVTIRSAVQASSSVPGVVKPASLYAKGANGRVRPYLKSRKWCDGSVADDLPAKRLARLFGVNHYIVSLINPVAIPFVEDPKMRPTGGLRRSLVDVASQIAQGSLVATERLSAKLGTNYFSPALLLADALIDQKYTGDINLILEKNDYRWRDVLFGYANDEDNAAIEALKLAGMRSTWPKLPMIKNSTAIAKTIDGILREFDDPQGINESQNGKALMTSII